MTWRAMSARPCSKAKMRATRETLYAASLPPAYSRAAARITAACRSEVYRQGLTLVHFSAQPKPFPTQNNPLSPPYNP